jgi:hypothetical protein
LLEEQIDAVRRDPTAGTLDKARSICSLITVAIKALEQRDLVTRLQALEAVLKRPERADVRAA